MDESFELSWVVAGLTVEQPVNARAETASRSESIFIYIGALRGPSHSYENS